MTPKKVIRCFIGMLWYGFAGITILTAVFLTLARLLLPLAEDYRVEAEQALSEYAGQPVRVASLKAEWSGFEPQLHFYDVRLYDKDNDNVLFQFADARMGINLFASVKNRDFVPSSFTISGVELAVTRHADNRFSIDGLKSSSNDSEQEYSDIVLKWLLRQRNIGIESSVISWTDVPLNEKSLTFKDVNFRLRNHADTHQLDGSVVLPESLGETINIALEMKGGIDDFNAWSGDVYVKAKSLDVPSWWRKPLLDGVALKSGRSDFELWGKWQDKTLRNLEGGLSLSELVFSGARSASLDLKSVSTAMLWNQDDSGWSLHLGKFSAVTGQGKWPESEISLRSDSKSQRFAAVLGYVQLADVIPVANAFQLLDKKIAKQLDALQLNVNLHDASLLLSTDASVEQWHLDGRFSALSTQPWEGVPGVNGLSGAFMADNQQGSLQLDSKQATLDTAGLFRQPLELLSASGSVVWANDKSGLSVQATDLSVSNSDISLRARMDLLIPEKGTPVIDLLADFKDADASKTYKYLPVSLLSKDTVAWLDKSIIQGTSPVGKVILHGPLDKFPFDHGEGRFEVRFDVIDGKLDYEPGWPVISEMQGEVIFSGRSMDIVGDKGRILDATVHDVTARIADIDLDDPVLKLRGKVASSTQDVIQYVIASNLAKGYSQELRQLSSTGNAAIELDISIPTVSGNGTVNGHTVLTNATLGLKNSKVKLQAINGKVQVSNDGLQGDSIKGSLFKTPVKIQLSHSEDAATAMSLKVKGQFDLNQLAREQFDKQLPILAVGKTQWQAELSFRNPEGEQHPVVLELDSELKGVTVDLPAPFAKQADAIIPIKFTSFLQSQGDHQLEVDYGDDVSVIVALTKPAEKFEYAGASIAFGDELPVPPSSKRISILGQLDALSIDEWLSYSKSASWLGKEENSDDALVWLEEVNLEVATLTALNSNFSVKSFRLEREDEHWHTTIDAERIKGEIIIPYNLASTPVKSNLALLSVNRVEDSSAESSFDPRNLPSLDLSVDQLVFDGVEFGTLNLTATRTPTGVTMQKLVVSGPEVVFIANGDWQIENDEQVTNLVAKLKAEKFSKLLTDLGYSAGFEAGKSRNTARLRWVGSPLQFSVAKLDGTMQIKIDKGQLLDISPGAGRIFGLLSLQALPRRLTLDFSDLFKKGFSFDRIKGNFQLEQGDAYTTDLYLDGPAARLDVSGRTGLVSRDYDQLITVTPDLTGSLPLAGALVGGPIAGGVVFALDKLLRPAIDDITRYQYTVTGSWDDPSVEKLEEVAVDSAGVAAQ